MKPNNVRAVIIGSLFAAITVAASLAACLSSKHAEAGETKESCTCASVPEMGYVLYVMRENRLGVVPLRSIRSIWDRDGAGSVINLPGRNIYASFDQLRATDLLTCAQTCGTTGKLMERP